MLHTGHSLEKVRKILKMPWSFMLSKFVMSSTEEARVTSLIFATRKVILHLAPRIKAEFRFRKTVALLPYSSINVDPTDSNFPSTSE